MKKNDEASKQIEALSETLRQFASEAKAMAQKLSSPADVAGLRARLRQLQASVDQLRKEVWQARRSAEIIELSRRTMKSPAKPNDDSSLVERVLAIFDRRCG